MRESDSGVRPPTCYGFRVAAWGVVLALIWLASSGHTTPLLLALGGCSVVMVLALSSRMAIIDRESLPLGVMVRIIPYHLWLLGQIARSSLVVARQVWVGPASLQPVLAEIDLGQGSDLGRVIYANSITLTPGTAVVGLEGDRALVHALNPECIDSLRKGAMGRRVRQLEVRG